MSASFGKSKSEGEMPKEMRQIIKEGWSEMGDLREMLIGQFMGILSGGGAYESYREGATEGYYEEYDIPGGNTGGEGGHDIPASKGKRWVPGQKGHQAWRQTEGGGSKIPMIAQAQEAQRRATSQALTGSQESLAMKGLAGTPFGEQIMAGQRQQGAQAVQGVESQFIQQMLSLIPGYTQGQSQSVMGALPGTRETNAKAWNTAGGVG